MEPLAFHLTFRAVDSRVIAPDLPAQRQVANVLHSIGEGYELLAFRAAGDHLHVQAACDRAEAGKLARSVAGRITKILGLPGFLPAHFTACEDQDHLEEAFLYILRNAEKHGVTNDPMHEASSIGGLLGMRVVAGAFLGRVRKTFPSLDRRTLLAVLGVRVLEPAFSLEQLADAAAGAVGLVELDGSAVAKPGLVAAVHVAAKRVSPAAIAEALGISERSVRRHREDESIPFLERAIGLRLGLRAALGDRAKVELPVPARPEWRRGRAGLVSGVVSPRRPALPPAPLPGDMRAGGRHALHRPHAGREASSPRGVARLRRFHAPLRTRPRGPEELPSTLAQSRGRAGAQAS